jgi:hypothetical protein
MSMSRGKAIASGSQLDMAKARSWERQFAICGLD